MNDLKFERFLNSTRKPKYISSTIHIVECLLVSMESAAEVVGRGEDRQLALAMYALYLRPYNDIVRNHPRYFDFESLYEEAVIALAHSDMECPCSVCEDEEGSMNVVIES